MGDYMRANCNALGSINTESVNTVRLNKILDPGLVARDDVWKLSVDIGQGDLGVSKPAVLLAGDVAIVDRTVLVIMRLQ